MELPGLPLEVSYGKPGSLNYLLFSLLGGSLRGANPPVMALPGLPLEVSYGKPGSHN